MVSLSHYVVKTRTSPEDNRDLLFNTITKTCLPLSSTEDTLRKNFFLAGQESDCLNHHLYRTPNKMMITVIPTWVCNLRCSHCSVLHLLEKKSKDRINIPAFEKFFTAYFNKFPIEIATILYVGGEAMLEVEQCSQLHDVLVGLSEKYGIKFLYTTTTNLAYNLTQNHFDFFSKLDSIQISIDGDEEQHNEQRHVFDGPKENLYNKTVNNLRRLVKAGLREKLEVQAAVKDEYMSLDYAIEFYKKMVKYGVLFDKIRYGGIHPTVLNPKQTRAFKDSLKDGTDLRNIPCCKFRLLRSIQVNPDNTVFDNFYVQEGSKLGTLFDGLDDIEKINRDNISKMPILQDEKCMQCPVIGYCWGGCIKGYPALGNKPSSLCNQKGLMEKVKTLAETGELINSQAGLI